MAGELLSFGIQKLWSLLSHERERFLGVEDQVTELQTELTMLKAYLKDADAKKHTSARARNCVEMIKEIIYDAEDIIETFILKDGLAKNGGIKKHINKLACIIPERRDIALKIGSLNKRISKMICYMKDFGIQQIIADGEESQAFPERLEFARKNESNLVGLEENVEKLVGYLVEEDDVQVVSITGMGGLGKTTLARQTYNHKMVKNKFDRLAWVCVTQEFNRKNVWQTILQNFRPKEEEKEIMKMTEARLQDELIRVFETSKSLIVFDDIWKEQDWSLIKLIFPAKKGWKVLLTSRNENVGRTRDTTYINLKPECLTSQESWTLFKKIAMPRKDASELDQVDKEMEEMGKQMIEYCRGLPLAVIVLGGLLGAKYTLHYWRYVSENIGSHLLGRTNFNDSNNNSFNRVLSLSFEELPSYLKYCFLYLAHFPEDYEINVEDLANYWVAEGILRFNNGDTLQDVGDSCIEELVRRNMVISERDNTTLRFETCRLHDLMREICLSKAGEENFVQTIGICSLTAHTQSPSSSRRFVSQYPTTFNVKRDITSSKVRSLVVIKKEDWKGSKISSLSFKRLQLLRVLDLRGARFKRYKLPYSIGKLIHLRYLNLSDALLSHLPSSLRNLKLLIYLSLCVRLQCKPMPDFLIGMKELKYLALPFCKGKTNLGMGHLVNLETLLNFSIGCCSLEDLHGMATLKTLGIFLTGESTLETLSASIGGFRHLENLHIRYRNKDEGTKKWGTLLDFPNLKRLELCIHDPLLSDGLQFPSRPTKIDLRQSHLEEDPMPILEKLLMLKEAKLWRSSFIGKRMVCSAGGFPQLQVLHFWVLEEWEEWIVEEGSMPLLHTLKIRCCYKLKDLTIYGMKG